MKSIMKSILKSHKLLAGIPPKSPKMLGSGMGRWDSPKSPKLLGSSHNHPMIIPSTSRVAGESGGVFVPVTADFGCSGSEAVAWVDPDSPRGKGKGRKAWAAEGATTWRILEFGFLGQCFGSHVDDLNDLQS